MTFGLDEDYDAGIDADIAERIYAWQDVIAAEYVKAAGKFPAFHSGHEGFAVIREELDELWDSVKGDEGAERQAAEAVQVAAMALRYLIDLC